jgi:hypothetical protein
MAGSALRRGYRPFLGLELLERRITFESAIEARHFYICHL